MNTHRLEDILITKQISPTNMRLMVLDHMLKQQSAISITGLENEFERSDRITLYRTLKTFEKKGLIHSINDGTVTKYAMCEDHCTENHHADSHLHFYCTSCKETFCLPRIKTPEIKLPGSFKMQELSLIARGLCEKCSA
ncbi:transcriptional repressor [Emticicia sp. CRIBPO]|uniref:Fur family transcriptional regulator n=1 Tax=Emticicia sp. CRIBPO TaxID=2683258 RepID=UPI0014125636|nr:transcriptional repressor [Emticicia sp. CRIBPO]NBA86802.1 transcriptional repressor [Emticicia sp. CRIBPO]